MSSVQLTSRFEDFFRSSRDENGKPAYLQSIRCLIVDGKRSLNVSFEDLERHDSMVARRLLENPEESLKDGIIALKRVITSIDPNYIDRVKRVYLRILDLPDRAKVFLRYLRSAHIGKMIQIEAMVTKTTEIKPLLVRADFECKFCRAVQQIILPEGRYAVPAKCINQQCGKTGSGAFRLLAKTSEFIDWQKITLQERPEELPPGQMPESFVVYLQDDLVAEARPGDRVRAIGIMQARASGSLKSGQLATFFKYLDTVSIEKETEEYQKIVITESDKEKIEELSNDPFIHDKITASIAPSIYGYDDEKEAISLLIFGGTSKELEDGTKLRGESNILLIGDPGVGKSQILAFVAGLVPRGVFTSGKGSSAAGLTVAVIRDQETGEMTLEAGALVLADRGIAIIDEFDKMRVEDRSALHEAMEQHRVSIAKAGIVATLNARTSILAAANPKLGRWDPNAEPIKNLNLPPTILSRFDLIFPMIDEPNPVEDKKKADYILRIHKTGILPREMPIEKELLRKYIAHARQKITPKLTDEARAKLLDYYVKLRARSTATQERRTISITPRQLESLVRLSEARAKQALRNHVTEEDAAAAVRLMESTLRKIAMDPTTGDMDIDRVTLGKGSSAQSKMSLILQIVDEISLQEDLNQIPVNKVKEKAIDRGITEKLFDELMEILRRDGTLYEPKLGYISKL